MKRSMRRLLILLLLMIACFSTAHLVLAITDIPSATSDFYVNDFAGVFTETEKSKLMANAVTLEKELDGIQVVVTTIKSLDGDTIENYAYNMYNKYGVGKNDMGLLILLATEDRQIRVEVGRGMEAYINDAKAGRFIDEYAIEYLSNNKFNEGLISLQDAFIAEIRSCINSDTITEPNTGHNINVDLGTVFGVIVILCFIAYDTVLVILIVNKAKKKTEDNKRYIEKLESENSSVLYVAQRLRENVKSLEQDKIELQKMLNETKQQLSTLQCRHKRILLIYPDVDQKVDEQIEAEKIEKCKQAARRVDDLILTVINLKPDKSLVDRLQYIKTAYNHLTSDEAKYVEADINKLESLYSACAALKREYDEQLARERRQRITEERKAKAADITRQLLAIISFVGIVSASDFSKLRQAKRLYDDLDSETKSYVDSSVVSKLDEMLRRAKCAKEEEEQAEAERRRRQYNSSTSFGSSNYRGSSYRGSGGRSGGGGASRRF